MKKMKHARLAAMGSNINDFLVIENNAANPVAGSQCTPGSESSNFSRSHRFHGPAAAEEHGPALVNHKEYRPLSFFRINPYMWGSQPGCSAPVHSADIIPGVIMTQFLEVQSPASQAGTMSSCQQRSHRLTGQKTEPASLCLETDERLKTGLYAGGYSI
jgi:hypothetical protein